MNSIKNAIVTATLLAVGFGSYVILKDPSGARFADRGSTGQTVLVDTTPSVASGQAANHVANAMEAPQIRIDVPPPPVVDYAPSSTPADIMVDVPDHATMNQRTRQPTSQPVASFQPPPMNADIELPPLPDLLPSGKSEMQAAALTPRKASNGDFDETLAPPIAESANVPMATEPSPEFQNRFETQSEIVKQSTNAAELEPVVSKIEPPVAELSPSQFASAATTPAGDRFVASEQPPVSNVATGADAAGVASALTAAATAIQPAFPAGESPTSTPDPQLTTAQDDLPSINIEVDDAVGIPPINESVAPIPPNNAAEGSLAFERMWLETQQDLRDGNLVAALRALTPWAIDSGLNQEQSRRCMTLLDQLAGTVIYSRESMIDPAYVVQAGETLEEIATKFAVPKELLARINGIVAPYALSTGEQLKTIRGPFRAVILPETNQLILYVGRNYAGRFNVKLGRDLPREAAFYDVAEKTPGRSYFDRRLGREVLKGEPGNRYGAYWLGLRGEHITTGHSVGIHSRPVGDSDVIQPSEVGSVSLDPIDAGDLFSILSVGSRVEIRP